MTTLFIKSSALGEYSVTNELVDFARSLLPDGASSALHDFGAQPLPHLDASLLQALSTPVHQRSPEQTARAKDAEALTAELLEAKTLVIGASMYNFGVSSTLKSYLDHVMRAGATFRYGPNGPEGLATGKRAILVVASGGVYSQGPAAPLDFVTPYLRSALSFIGITDVTVVRAEGVAFGPDARSQTVAAAKAQLAQLLG